MHPFVDLLVCLRFFSRLPVPSGPGLEAHGARGLAAATTMVPVAGAIVGLVPAGALLAGLAVGLPPLLSASIAIATLVLATGAIHEDGLADCADGFGGGQTVARKLEIMRDSRIGTFATCAVVLSLLIRVAALGVIAARAPSAGAAAIIAAAMASRSACLVPLALLPAARAEGLGASAGRPDTTQLGAALVLTAILALCIVPFGFGFGHVVVALAAAFLTGTAVSAVAWQQIGGQTGDVAGAAQQVAEMAILAVLSAA